MTGEHTPGPWEWDFEEAALSAPDPQFPDDETLGAIVLELDQRHGSAWPSDADAVLIAAAPNLLAALRECVKQMAIVHAGNSCRTTDHEDAFVQGCAAIHKAKGV